ncbi:glutamate-cysteine ligase family protein [Stieleria varia]|uniref:Carboxylate-amine ligase YbdK n=1 Tax=Stieleria varia TaxID=2528005 RepID=A0A5C6A2B9_9BACT|nr:glutamate-cysteine ligase family protein [Stieleria varia]TWT94002.1 Carboxylate-amine ligase YbdK [Stieleria varia]
MSRNPLGLFDAFGVELEYMIVDRQTLDVRSVADEVLCAMAGTPTSDVERGPITWSNELAAHVIELKTTMPEPDLATLPQLFRTAINDLDHVLEPMHLMLLPTAAHPWMNPEKETELWPHEGTEIYRVYDRIFNCRSHGWGNVQSVHLNLPFDGAEQFARLHAAIRLILPLLPALAASSPVVDGAFGGFMDCRMKSYADHCSVVPVMTGDVIPEAIYDEASYRSEIFGPIAAAIEPHDSDRLMQTDFLNARGAIARFDRGSIEIRVMDVQEYPAADVAISAAVVAVLRRLVDETWTSHSSQREMPAGELRRILDATTMDAERAEIDSAVLLNHFGFDESSMAASEFWQRLLSETDGVAAELSDHSRPLQVILSQGSLASRIMRALGPSFDSHDLHRVYGRVGECLRQWGSFEPA